MTKEHTSTRAKLANADVKVSTLVTELDAVKAEVNDKDSTISNLNAKIQDHVKIARRVEKELDTWQEMYHADIKSINATIQADFSAVQQHWAKKYDDLNKQYAELKKSADDADNELFRMWGREELGDTTEGGTKPQRFQYKYFNKYGNVNAAGLALPEGPKYQAIIDARRAERSKAATK